MKKPNYFLISLSIFFLFLNSCKKDQIDIEYQYYGDYSAISEKLNLPSVPLEYTLNFPKYYNSVQRSFDKDQATAGRVLFYDNNLSKDRSISCGSCHLQKLAFTDGEVFSNGIENRKTKRNSLALGSVFSFNEYYGSVSSSRIPFFWDNRASSVSEQSTQTFANENEMGMEMHQVLARVKEQPYYNELFKAAYGNLSITEDRVLECISTFVNSIASFNNRYDKELDKMFPNGINSSSNIQNTYMPGFTMEENLGKNIFLINCGNCHGEINGRPGKLKANNGLSLNYEDAGIQIISNSNDDLGKFKIPTLRNIALTSPYMHDGSIATLQDVIEHYNSGLRNHPNLDDSLKSGGQPKQLGLTQEEKDALLSFLETFTDESSITDAKYSNPFK